MRQATPEVADEVATLIRRSVRHHRRAQLIRQMMSCAAIFCVWLIAACLLDRWLALASTLRVISECGVAGLILLLMSVATFHFFRRFDWIAAAAAVEDRDRRFAGRLVTVVSEAMQPANIRGSESLRDALEAQTVALSRSQDELTMAGMKWTSAIGGASVALVVIGGVLLSRSTAWPLIIRQLAPLSGEPPVTAAMLRVGPGNVSHPGGEPFTITATARGLGAGLPVLSYILGDSAGNPGINSAVMPADGDGYVFRFSALNQPLKYQVRVGYSVTPWYAVTIRPQMQSVKSIATTRDTTSPPTAQEQAEAAAYLRAMGGHPP